MKNFCVAVILILISVLPAYAGKWATGTTAPVTCAVGDSWTDTNGTADNRFYTCTATNTWTLNSNQTAIDAKANKASTVMLWSEWADGAAFTTTSPPIAYNGSLYKCTAPYTKVAGETPNTQTDYFAEVIGSGGGTGIAHATSDGAYYASKDGAWAPLTGAFATPLGADDNYATDAEKEKLGNLSGTNTGDQDLSGYALTSSVLSKTNTTAFTPTADYHPATKKYVDDSITASGGYTDEQAQDAAGAMFSSNTETGITVTYDDATGKVNFVVPTTLAGFTDDSTHRVVTDTEKSTWNAKQNALVAGTDYLAPAGIGASLTFNATGFNGNLATTTNTIQELADAVDDLPDATDDQTAAEVSVADTAGHYTATNVETVLAEIGAYPLIAWGTGLTETVGTGTNTISVTANTYQAYDADWLGITPNGAALVSAANYAAMKTLLDTDDIQTLTGIAAGTAHLGTFTGTTIADSSTIKTAIQSLETSVETKAPSASPVFTASAAIPQGSSPTVDAAGEIALDLTSDQLIYYGGAKRVLTYKKQIDFAVKTPVDADDFLLFKAQTAMTITDIHVIAQGGTSISVNIQECDSAGANCATVDAAITATTTGAEDDGTLSNGTIDTGDWVKVVLGAPSGTVNYLAGSIYYVETAD